MPRYTPEVPQQELEHTIVASSMSYPGARGKKAQRPTKKPWQREAWEFYDLVGELHYAATWISSVCSRAVLVAAVRNSDGLVSPSDPDSDESRILDELFGGVKGQSQMIRALALHLFVAGECYIVGRSRQEEDGGVAEEDLWEVVGIEEIDSNGDVWTLKYEGRTPINLTETDTVFRVWQPHPRNRMLADSPVRSVLPVLREIRFFDRHIQSQSRSRLTGNGLLLMPAEIQFAGTDGTPQQSAAALSEVLGTSMVNAQECDGEPSAEDQVPVVVTAPGEHIGNARWMTFWSDLDEKAYEMRSGAVRRLALGLDIPQEIVTGTGEMNHWGAWQVEESSVKAHIEPLLDLITTFLSVDYLQPVSGNDTAIVAHDTTELRLRPNRSREAIELYDRGVLSPETTLRETGFTTTDAPDDDDRRLWILHQMVKASWSPDQAQAAASALGVNLNLPYVDNRPREARPIPSLEQHPNRGVPEESEPVVAGAMLALRAMQRAGNRLRTISGHKPEGVLAENTHCAVKVFKDRVDDLLLGGFDAEGLDVPDEVLELARSYCHSLLSSGEPYSYQSAKAAISKGLS